MIRFCDRKVKYIDYCKVLRKNAENRRELLSFLEKHQDVVICVYDNDVFRGIITYQSLKHFMSVIEAVRIEYLVLDENIWRNARDYCKRYPEEIRRDLIPVLDKDKKLYCFAYEDLDANREIRILRELTESPEILQFTDIYPQYKFVKIYGFNELAYFFAKYLQKLDITVELSGTMWQEFFDEQAECRTQDYECFRVYADGINEKKRNWKENLLQSVSVEFECLDKVYEENLRKGLIKDVYDNFESLIAKLKKLKAVAILGIDIEAQDAYDNLIKMGVRVCCFVLKRQTILKRKLLGIPVLSFKECIRKYGNSIVFIDNHGRYSTFGCSMKSEFDVDYLDYLGYERNRNFYMLKDYIQVKGHSLKTILKNQKIILVGNICLCERLVDYFKEGICEDFQFQYLAIPDQKIRKTKLELINVDEMEKDSFILIVMPEYLGWSQKDEDKERIISFLNTNGFINYSDYFSYSETWIILEEKNNDKYPINYLRVNNIAIGSIESCCGNYFFKGLMDNHPHIMMMNFENFDTDLFWFCIQLADKTAEEVLYGFNLLFDSLFWLKKWERKNEYVKVLSDVLDKSAYRYTSQQLFILFHIAYMRLYGRKIENVRDLIIYWAPHLPSTKVEKYREWLSADNMKCNIINVVRNTCMSKGSRIRGVFEFNWTPVIYVYRIAIERYDNNQDFRESNRIVLRFEDIKCNPREELLELCRKLEIPWSDSLMSTTHHDGNLWTYDNGEKIVQDFDLAPVYNNNEEYFSEFDRFRLVLICGSWQKQHGYPYVDILSYSRRDLQEIFLKDFRFADKVLFGDSESKLDFFIDLQRDIRRFVQQEYMYAILDAENSESKNGKVLGFKSF